MLRPEFVDKIKQDKTIKPKNMDALVSKLQALITDGKQEFHIISDFDMTLTKYWHQGKRSPSSHGVLFHSDKVTDEYKAAQTAVYNKYYPIEISQTHTLEEKIFYMVEWWTKAQ